MTSTTIIAEAGVNHNGNVLMAKKLIEAAAEAGADYVKFQTFRTNEVMTSTACQADYQIKNTGIKETQQDMVRRLELSNQSHYELLNHCKVCGIRFLSTAFDIPSARFLNDLGLGIFKIPSGEITNLPYLRLIGSYDKPIIISTGMCKLGEIEDAIRVLGESGIARSKITILHCTSEYPAPFSDVNLRALSTLRKAFGCSVGHSDHTEGIEVSIAAVAMGALVIEKHFTLDRNLPGPDHKASLEPDELKRLVSSIRNVELAMGDGIKSVMPSERGNKLIARKSIVATRRIAAGEVFSTENISAKRPETGLSPMRWDEVINRIAPRDFDIDEQIVI